MQYWRTILYFIMMLNEFKTSAFKGSTLDYCYKEDNCNPYSWGKNFQSCIPDHTKLHSPIDLSDTVQDVSIPDLQPHGFNVTQKFWNVSNNGHTVRVKFEDGMTIEGGSLKHRYSLLEMRFHWGSNVTYGSEHTLNNRRFPMEMQVVAIAPGFPDEEAASKNESGLVMMGVFIDIGDEENKQFKVISDAITKVSRPGDSVNVVPPALEKLMPGPGGRVYYYQGGQTTPPCLQTVSWVLFQKPVYISKHQYLLFATGVYYSAKLDSELKVLTENYRPIQTSSKHQIFASSEMKRFSARGKSQSLQTSFILLLTLLFLLRLLI